MSDEFIERVRAKLPELPDQKSQRFQKDFGLSAYDAEHLVENAETTVLFDEAMDATQADGEKRSAFAKQLANLIINDVTAWLNAEDDLDLGTSPMTPTRLATLASMLLDEKISSKQAKEVFSLIIEEDKDPEAIVSEHGMEQVSDTGAIEAVVDRVLADNPDKVEEYKGGKTGLIGFFVGQCMKAMQGQGNPKIINEMLAQKLDG